MCKGVKSHFEMLSPKNISEKNSFCTYENFKNFVLKHYDINHIEKNNYIKFVKIKRQILKLNNEELYNNIIYEINSCIKILHENHVFPCIDIKKYMYKINAFYVLIEKKRLNILNTIQTIRNLFVVKWDDLKLKIKVIITINQLIFRHKVFVKFTKKILYFINKLIDLEHNYGIDHKLIELHNMERTFLGKKSEYTANKVLHEYVQKMNNTCSKNYFYLSNINFLKLLKIEIMHKNKIKGEIDGIIISYDGETYLIEKLIEVKSSIKATFEDLQKFIYLQKYINDLPENINISYKNFTFTKESFAKINKKELANWTTYICINNTCNTPYVDTIEKSHIYFSTVLKIVDERFINDFYVENNEKSIIEKYNIISNNRELIDLIYLNWEKNIKFDSELCNVFISKISI